MQGPKKGKMTQARRLAAVEAMEKYRPFDQPHSQVAEAWLKVLQATNDVDKDERPVGLTTVKTAVKKYYPNAEESRSTSVPRSSDYQALIEQKGQSLADLWSEAEAKKEAKNKGKARKSCKRKSAEMPACAESTDQAESSNRISPVRNTDSSEPAVGLDNNGQNNRHHQNPTQPPPSEPFESLDRAISSAEEAQLSQRKLHQKMDQLMQQQLAAYTNMHSNLKEMTECYKEMNRIQAEALDRQAEVNRQFMQAMMSSQQQFFGQLNVWMQHVNASLSRIGQPPMVAAPLPAAPIHVSAAAPVLAPATSPMTTQATGPITTVFRTHEKRDSPSRKRSKKQ